MSPNVTPERVVQLHERLRAFLLKTMPQESPVTIGAALMYEVTSLAATGATTPDQADRLLRDFFAAARDQIRAFGVGAPHP